MDAYSGRTIAQTGQMRGLGETFLMGGRVLEVVWRDRYRLGVRDAPGKRADETVRFMTAPFAVPLDVSQAVAAHLGVASGQLTLVHDEQGALLFHFWGDLYGALPPVRPLPWTATRMLCRVNSRPKLVSKGWT